MNDYNPTNEQTLYFRSSKSNDKLIMMILNLYKYLKFQKLGEVSMWKRLNFLFIFAKG